MSYSDYLDYWLENYCHVNLKYHTIEAYTNIIKNHIRPRFGYATDKVGFIKVNPAIKVSLPKVELKIAQLFLKN